MVASWNSIPLEITYRVLGWLTFTFWSVGFYPQVILNFRRKSVVGLSIDFVVLNFTKHSSYLIYNATLYFSSAVQKQYFDKYGFGEMIPVAANDVAFSAHAVFVTAVMLFQIAIYERGSQKVSKIAVGIVVAVWLFAAICFFVALPTHSWLWLISIFNSIQVFMTVIKYTPQAYMNFIRKSTDGLSIFFILLDFSGGVGSYAQMAVQSIDQDSWVNFYGNIGKTLLSLICVSYDLLFIFQHFVLYPSKKALISPKVVISKENLEPLVSSDSHQVSENV
ncbi:PREDICTED: cystinosin homolog [Fragaria vesca subsp. vesca]|uniref:cystinosin homolog n=1 Tax=Fragaria vesca subsp. vesca TaxID=101020 RepID=UPI0002C2F433|nr:PREDICTED: cystinosin homolog [Fragaria vesca subsp. vesca]